MRNRPRHLADDEPAGTVRTQSEQCHAPHDERHDERREDHRAR